MAADTSRRSAVGRVLASYACASVANGLPWPLLLVLVWDQHGDGPHGAWAVGLAGAARMAPYVLLSWAVGSLGDHVRRDRLIRVTLALRTAFLSLTAVAVATDHVGLAVLAAALAVTVGTPAYPAIAAALPRLAGPDRTRATEALVTIEVSAWVVGPAFGGLLLAPDTRSWSCVIAAGLAALGLLLFRGVLLPGPSEPARAGALRGMLRTVGARRSAVGALGLAGLLNLVLTTTGIVLLPLSQDGWGQGDSGFGTATAFLGFGALGAPLLCRLVTATTARGLAALSVALLLVAGTPVPWVALPLLALAGASAVAVESLVTGTLQRVVPDRHRAGALGLADAVMVSACLVGSLVGPHLAGLAGARPSMVLVATLCLAPFAVTAVARARPTSPLATPAPLVVEERLAA